MSKRQIKQVGVFEKVAQTHEKWARDLQACIPQMGPVAAPAIMREVAHHLECAARIRGTPIIPLSLKEQSRIARDRWR